MQLPACFRLITAVSVPTEYFTAGVLPAGQMAVPGKLLAPGREKSDPAALLLASAAAVTTALPEAHPDTLPVLESMGFRTAVLRRNAGSTTRVLDAPAVSVADSRLQAYCMGSSALAVRATHVMEHGQARPILPQDIPAGSSRAAHYAALDREGRLIWLGWLEISQIPQPDPLAVASANDLTREGIRVVLSRRPSRREWRPDLQVLCAGEQLPTAPEKSFAAWVREQNRRIRRNRVLAAAGCAAALVLLALIFILI